MLLRIQTVLGTGMRKSLTLELRRVYGMPMVGTSLAPSSVQHGPRRFIVGLITKPQHEPSGIFGEMVFRYRASQIHIQKLEV